MDGLQLVGEQLTPAQLRARAQIVRHTADQRIRPDMRGTLLQIAEQYDWLAQHFESSNSGRDCEPSPIKKNSDRGRLLEELTDTEREWLSAQRARSCKHGHPRQDARVYRNQSGSLWLDCAQCVRNRVNAYRRRMANLTAQAR